MPQHRILFVLALALSLLTLRSFSEGGALTPPLAFAHAGEKHVLPPVTLVKFAVDSLPKLSGEVTPCAELPEIGKRLDCYEKLCEPSYECSEAILIRGTAEHGPEIGITVLTDLLSASARFKLNTDGHELGHIIGRTTGKVLGYTGQSFMRCPIEYLYACQHGFFEQALGVLEGSTADIASRICESITEEPVGRNKFYCYHGVGHGIMMASQNDLFASIQDCDSIPNTGAPRGCWQGAFMENINAYLGKTGREGMFPKEDILSPCSQVPLGYQWECYVNHAARLVHETSFLKEAAAACLAAHPESAPSCILGLGQFLSNPGWQAILVEKNPKYLASKGFIPLGVEMCQDFPEKYLRDCYLAATGNITNYAGWNDAVEYCSLVPEEWKLDCFGKVGLELQAQGKNTKEIEEVCTDVPTKFKGACLHGYWNASPPSSVPSPSGGGKGEGPLSLTLSRGEREGVPSPEVWEQSFLARLLAAIQAFFEVLSGKEDRPTSAPQENVPSISWWEKESQRREGAQRREALQEVEGDVIVRFTPARNYLPSKLTIQKGQTVTFVNESGDLFWPASNVHPTHELYPELDPRKPIGSGKSWSHTFLREGRWGFHDHLYPSVTGTVIVE